MIRKVLFSIIFLVILMGNVYASVDIKIDVKPSFSLGETVKFDYTFTSDVDEKIIYTPRISCIENYNSILEIKSLDLKKDIPVKYSYEVFRVTESTNPQQCLAIINIKEPFIKVKEEVFELLAQSPVSFNIYICKDSSCGEKLKIFIKNENVYLSYYSDIQDLTMLAKLTYPDGTVQQITLPTLIKAEQIGMYDLEVTASKEGYKTTTLKDQFVTMKQEAKIETVSGMETAPSTSENKSSESETSQMENEKVIEEVQKDNSIFVIITFTVFTILIVIMISLLFKRKGQKIEYYYSNPNKKTLR